METALPGQVLAAVVGIAKALRGGGAHCAYAFASRGPPPRKLFPLPATATPLPLALPVTHSTSHLVVRFEISRGIASLAHTDDLPLPSNQRLP